MSEIQLRPVTQSDRPFLIDLFLESNQDFAALPLPPQAKAQLLAQQYEFRQQSYQTRFPDSTDQIICRDDLPVGRWSVDIGDRWLTLIEISLVPHARNQGIGTFLIGKLQEDASAHRKPIELHVASSNPAALRLYERLGFESLSSSDAYIRMRWQESAGGSSAR